MWLTLSIASAVIFGAAGWFMKVSQMKGGSIAVLLIWLYIVGTLGFGVHTIMEGSWQQLAVFQVWISGLLIGIGSAFGNYLFMKALGTGPASLTSPLLNANIVLVILMGTFIYHEPLGFMQFISIALLLIATVLIAQRKDNRSITSYWWFVYIAAAIVMFAIRNGGLKVTAELGYASAPVLFVAYLLSILFFAPAAVREQQISRKNTRIAQSSYAIATNAQKVGLRYGLISGICSYGGLQLYAVALQDGPANLVAPIFATNGLLVSVLSILVYKERLSRMQTAAFICLLVGLVCIRISLHD